MQETDPKLDLWLGKPAPRYTSYPPATAFHSEVVAQDYINSLRLVPEDAAVSLYLHILFCRKLCLYCGCHTAITNRADRIENYLNAIIKECEVLSRYVPHGLRLSHLHLGGGTPNSLSAEQLRRLFSAMRTAFDFTSCREIAVELDPRYLTQDHIVAMVDCGVNRVSLGVQDFDYKVQESIGRVQPYELVEECCYSLRSAGIADINFDLMYGLPFQSHQTIENTAKQAIGLNPARIALFSYAHVPRFKKHQQALEAFNLPDAHEALAMESCARHIIEGSGYIPIGMDHFAQPADSMAIALKDGLLHRNFQGYTDDTAEVLLGLGASAIGQTPQGFFQNEKDERAYSQKMVAGELATVRGLLRKPQEAVRGDIISTLMCYMKCDISQVAARHGVDMANFADDWQRLEPFINAGIIRREGSCIELAIQHRMAMRVVARAFDISTPAGALASRAA